MKKIISVILVVTMLVLPATCFAAFSDVASNHWAAGFIEELSSKGIINGYPDGTFGPSDTLTRGQFLKLIVSASLEDVDYNRVETSLTHWAAPYLKVAENFGVLDEGKVTQADLDAPISRIEVVEILGLCDLNMRNHQRKGVDMLAFSDIQNATNTQVLLLSHAVANKIINGYEDGTFKPNNNLTRAEAAKILSVYMSIAD